MKEYPHGKEEEPKQYMLRQQEFAYNPEICLPKRFEVSQRGFKICPRLGVLHLAESASTFTSLPKLEQFCSQIIF